MSRAIVISKDLSGSNFLNYVLYHAPDKSAKLVCLLCDFVTHQINNCGHFDSRFLISTSLVNRNEHESFFVQLDYQLEHTAELFIQVPEWMNSLLKTGHIRRRVLVDLSIISNSISFHGIGIPTDLQ